MRSSIFLVFVLAVIAGCSREPVELPGGAVQLTAWVHSGREAERETIVDQVRRFNAGNEVVEIDLTVIPEGNYNAQVQAAALADDLPDLLEFDGPFVYNYVWQGHLVPLETLLAPAVRADLIPSIVAQGTYDAHLYSVGTFDSGLGLYGRRSRLEAAGARIPDSADAAWTVDEFERALAALAERDTDGQVLDLKLNYDGEWYTYAFSPVIESAGGDLIDRGGFRSSSGVLDGPESVAALRRMQEWIAKGYVDPNVDDDAFVAGRVDLSWVGHWEYRRYRESIGDDLVLLPLPNFGAGSKTGQGSWNWGVTTGCRHPELAARFLEFLLEPEEVLLMTNANGAVPATQAATSRSELYGAGEPLRLFAEQLAGGYSVPRPRTPAYPVITTAFREAFLDIRNGADVRSALRKAAATIDQDIADNHGYPFTPR